MADSGLPDKKPARRKRYSGTHPKSFAEKYKERDGGKYPELAQKLRAKGKTPAGTHVPVLVEEVIACLAPNPCEVIADCTVGYGGHARAFIKCIGTEGRLIAFDMDGEELEKTKARLAGLSCKMSFYRSNFAGILKPLSSEQLSGYDIIFADLGVSSMQVDDPLRGISYKNEGPLDMRMDKRLKQTGADLLERLSEQELSLALWELSDEPDHEKIAAFIVGQRQVRPITTTGELMRLVFNAKGLTEKTYKRQQLQSAFGSLHPAARTFQALRILVNDELGSLKSLLRLAPEALRPGGRVGIISFHSGEDRLVKAAFKEGVKDGIYETCSKDAIVPRIHEIMQNPRSSSAKFRWARKAAVL